MQDLATSILYRLLLLGVVDPIVAGQPNLVYRLLVRLKPILQVPHHRYVAPQFADVTRTDCATLATC